MDNDDLQEQVVDLQRRLDELEAKLSAASAAQGKSASRFAEYVKVKRENEKLHGELSKAARATLSAQKRAYGGSGHGVHAGPGLYTSSHSLQPTLGSGNTQGSRTMVSPNFSASLDIAAASAHANATQPPLFLSTRQGLLPAVSQTGTPQGATQHAHGQLAAIASHQARSVLAQQAQ
jgi:hypothetical protein